MTGARSAAFREAATTAKALNAGELELLEQACRIIDRLDRFDEMLADGTNVLAEVKLPKSDGGVLELVVNNVAAEARQHVAELRQVVRALNLPEAKAEPGEKSKLQVLLGGKTG